MASGLLGKVSCLLGIHWVPSWEYQREEFCHQEGGCRRCGKEQKRLQHQWDRNVCYRCDVDKF